MSFPVYVAMGSNIGNRLESLKTAICELRPHTLVTRTSNVYETPPWGYLEQPAFLNMVVEVQTLLTPAELLRQLQSIEQKIGRVKTILNGPRVIDLDIILFEDHVYEDEQLSIPHPRLRERAFVLLPLADVASELTHPIFKISISELLQECNLDGIIQIATAKELMLSLESNCSFVPTEIAIELKTNQVAARVYHHLPPSHQREYNNYVCETKKIETRQLRAKKVCSMLVSKD
jgi:2-amino-4-hydroxy-6-hydroxymethyldihydropteridine diphosphokinase